MQPKTFQELKDLCLSGQIDKERRFIGDQMLYDQYIAFVPDKIKDSILNIQISENKDKYNIEHSGFTTNLFGYGKKLQYLPLVKHCNIWIDDWDLIDPEIHELINAWILAIWNQKLDYCYFINKPNNRSIAHKPHAHVFINFENYNQ